jgi:AcrR family transcriptional regulator
MATSSAKTATPVGTPDGSGHSPASKEELLRHLCADGLERYIAAVEAALADDGDPWAAFTGFMRRVVDADVHSLTPRLAGTFTPDEDLYRKAEKGQALNLRLFERTKASGVLRQDVVVDDLPFLLEQGASVRAREEDRTQELRHRYLALLLDGLRAPATTRLPGPAPSWAEISQRWQT